MKMIYAYNYIFKHHGKVQRCKKKLSQILPPRNKQCYSVLNILALSMGYLLSDMF